MWHTKYNIKRRGTDAINDAIPMKHQKYPPKTILKHANVLAELSKSPCVHSYNMAKYKDIHYYDPHMHNRHIRN